MVRILLVWMIAIAHSHQLVNNMHSGLTSLSVCSCDLFNGEMGSRCDEWGPEKYAYAIESIILLVLTLAMFVYGMRDLFDLLIRKKKYEFDLTMNLLMQCILYSFFNSLYFIGVIISIVTPDNFSLVNTSGYYWKNRTYNLVWEIANPPGVLLPGFSYFHYRFALA